MHQDLLAQLALQAKSLFGVTLETEHLDLFDKYVRELGQWSRRFNLISVDSEAELVYRHLLDSIAVIPQLRSRWASSEEHGDLLCSGDALIDLGSGAGFPGIPIAIAAGGPVVLVESRRRRASFLRHVIRTLNLSKVDTVESRAEEVSLDMPVKAIVSRAVGTTVVAAFAGRVLGPDGSLLMMLKKGQDVAVAGFQETERFAYELPGGWKHEIVHFRKCFT